MTTTPPEGLEEARTAVPQPAGDVVPGSPVDVGDLPDDPLPPDDRELTDRLLAEIRQLREAVETRDVIGQAKGIVMVGFRCDPDTAFEVLCRMSQNTNRKVREVANLVVSTVVDDRPLPEDLQATLLAQFRAR